MLSGMINRWYCDIGRQRIRLWLNESCVHEVERHDSVPLATALETLLALPGRRRPWRDSIEYRMDIDMVWYLTVPWITGITSYGELLNYSQILAKQTFPALAERKIVIQFEEARYGKTALAVVMLNSVWLALCQAATRQKLRLRGATTPLQRVLVPQRRTLPESGIFSVTGEKSGVFARRQSDEWLGVYTLPLSGASLAQQLELVARLYYLPEVPAHHLNLVRPVAESEVSL